MGLNQTRKLLYTTNNTQNIQNYRRHLRTIHGKEGLHLYLWKIKSYKLIKQADNPINMVPRLKQIFLLKIIKISSRYVKNVWYHQLSGKCKSKSKWNMTAFLYCSLSSSWIKPLPPCQAMTAGCSAKNCKARMPWYDACQALKDNSFQHWLPLPATKSLGKTTLSRT